MITVHIENLEERLSDIFAYNLNETGIFITFTYNDSNLQYINKIENEPWYSQFSSNCPQLWTTKGLKLNHEDSVKFVKKIVVSIFEYAMPPQILSIKINDKTLYEVCQDILTEDEMILISKRIIQDSYDNNFSFIDNVKSDICKQYLYYYSFDTWKNITNENVVHYFMINMSLEIFAKTIQANHPILHYDTYADYVYKNMAFEIYALMMIRLTKYEGALKNMIKSIFKHDQNSDMLNSLHLLFANLGYIEGYFILYSIYQKDVENFFFDTYHTLYTEEMFRKDFETNEQKYFDYYGCSGRDFYFKLCFNQHRCIQYFIQRLYPFTKEETDILKANHKYELLKYCRKYCTKQEIIKIFSTESNINEEHVNFLVNNFEKLISLRDAINAISSFSDAVPKRTDQVDFVELDPIPENELYIECTQSSKHVTIHEHLTQCGCCKAPMGKTIYINKD